MTNGQLLSQPIKPGQVGISENWPAQDDEITKNGIF